MTMFGVLVIMAECIGFLVEIIVFTLMGMIVNAGSVLKYSTLLFLVIFYGYDAYNSAEKKYLKLNKSLFSEVKGRIRDMEEVTSLPSYLQENRGFKSQEQSEQAEYEQPDDVASNTQWLINDLVLFIDNEDMPRIPTQLFEDVCNIRVAGAPGPVYLSLLKATKSFLMICAFLCFMFLVVLSFGEVYQVSTTNQMLATLAGGLLPFILKIFIQANKPDIELGTVSFRSKLDEIIKNFFQTWPMYDFPLTVMNQEKAEKPEEKPDDAFATTGCICEYCACYYKHKHAVATQTTEDIGYPELNARGFATSTPGEEDDSLSTPLHFDHLKTVMGRTDGPIKVPEQSDQQQGITESQQAHTTTAMPSTSRNQSCPSFSTSPKVYPSVVNTVVPPKGSAVLSKKPSTPPIKKISFPRKTSLASGSVSTVPKQSTLTTIKGSPSTSRRQTSPGIVPPEDHGIRTIINMPLGTPQSARRPTQPDLSAHHGIKTVKLPPKHLGNKGDAEAGRHPNLNRRMTAPSVALSCGRPILPLAAMSSCSGQQTPPLSVLSANSDNWHASPSSAVENIPMLDRNQNIHNFLNSASDFKMLMGDQVSTSSKKDTVVSSIPARRDTIASTQASMPVRKDTLMSALDSDEEEDNVVDLLVFLPEHPDNELWLKEWSDMDEFEEPDESSITDQEQSSEAV